MGIGLGESGVSLQPASNFTACCPKRKQLSLQWSVPSFWQCWAIIMHCGNKNHRDNHNTTFVQSLNLSIKKTADLERVPDLAYLPHHHLITIMEPPWAHSALSSTCDIKST